MPDYKAPLRDIKFVMNELLDSEQHYANLEGAEDATPDMLMPSSGKVPSSVSRFCLR